MIYLCQPPGDWGLPSFGPFCVKLESYLRMANVPYQVKAPDFRKAPKGKIPFIEEDGAFMGDSQLIIEHLKRKHGDPLDAKLGAEEVAKGHAVRRMLEESTYWHLVHERWIRDEGWQLYGPAFSRLMPPVVRKIAVPMIRRSVRKALHAHGLGRHKPEEILELGKADISAVATLLGDKPFLLGDSPTSFDATVYAMIGGILGFPVDSPLRRHLQGQQNLVRYCERFQQRWFAEAKPTAAAA
jgi:glutathione S-transferase